MAKIGTDDEIAASACISEENKIVFGSRCTAKLHFKRALCETVVKNGSRSGTVDACAQDAKFVGPTVKNGGVGAQPGAPAVAGKKDPARVESAPPSRSSPEAAAARKWLEVSGTPFSGDEFVHAAGACDVEKVKLFLAAGIGAAERQKALDYRLSVATTDTRCDDVVSRLARSGVRLNGEHLLQAVVAGQRDHVSIVLGSGVDVNYAAFDGSTAAITAARVRNMGVMELLRDSGADLNRGDKRGTTPLMAATDLGDIDMVRFLLATPRLEVNRRDSAGVTALHMARLSQSARRLPKVRWGDLIDVLEKAGAVE